MPTYEYGCDACGAQWEMEQRISEDPIKKCPHCGKRKAKRLVSGGAGIIFKGGGWYADLYHKPKGRSESPDSAEASSGDTKSDASGGDASPKKESAKPKKQSKPAAKKS
jgi:putative FmdB family regulatory protein